MTVAGAILPYALLLSAGAYLTGAVLVIARRWIPPTRLPWWAVLTGLIAFGVDRLMPAYAIEAAPVYCVCAIVITVRILRSPGIANRRHLLWSVFALAPVAMMLVLSTAEYFPAADARTMGIVAAALLTVPGVAALLGAIARVISPIP